MLNPLEIDLDTKDLTVSDLIAQVESQSFLSEPRPVLWDDVRQSRMIESLILKIPILPFWFDVTTDDGKMRIIDGVARIHSINQFAVTKKLRLSGLEYLSEFNRCSFDDLPSNIQRRFLESRMLCHFIRPGVPEAIRENIRRRVRNGG